MLILNLVLVGLIVMGLNYKLGRTAYFLMPMILSISIVESLHWMSILKLRCSLLTLGRFFCLDYLDILWELMISQFTLTSVVMILFLSALIQVYSMSYMSPDLNITFFTVLITLFTFCMLLIILTNTTVIFLLGWEGVGLLSYLLINFWSLRIEANKASLKAIFMNKVGDLFLLFVIILLLNVFLSTNILVINNLMPYIEYELMGGLVPLLAMLALLLVGAGSIKSAQFMFSVWLPDAMEGPTPVSSLMHSATMVAAGLFLLLQFKEVLSHSPFMTPLMFYLGFMTSLIVSLDSTCMFDHKSVLAGSTCEQMALMFTLYGFGGGDLAFFHFCTHAFYKSLLFLSMGALIHQTGEQESSFTFIIEKSSPVTLVCYQMGLLSLMGFPGTISHYSKTAAFTAIYSQGVSATKALYLLTQLVQSLSSFTNITGAITLYFFTGLFTYRKSQSQHHAMFQNPLMKMPLMMLSLITLLGGLIMQNLYVYNLLLPSKGIILAEPSWLNLFTPTPLWVMWSNLYALVWLSTLYYAFSFYAAPTGVSGRYYGGEYPYTFAVDNLLNLMSLSYTTLCYDSGFIAMNEGMFSVSFYLRYLLFYNYFLSKLYNKASLLWLVGYQVTLLIILYTQAML